MILYLSSLFFVSASILIVVDFSFGIQILILYMLIYLCIQGYTEEDFCNDKTTEAVDYGFGDAQYKRSYCNQSWREASLYFFAPTLKGLKLNAARTATIGISQFAKSVLDRTGFLTKAKRVWRKHLTPEK